MGETFWEPLAELYVNLDGIPPTDQEDFGVVFCLCSRAIMCNPVHQPLEKTEYEYDSVEESSSDELQDKVSTNKAKQMGDLEEPGSCYGSASTDEPDSLCGVRNSSDSGADFGETLETEQVAQWKRHWAMHGPQIVWESWREKYADYMDPTADAIADPGETVSPETEQGALCSPREGCLDRIEDGMKSLGVAVETDRCSPLSGVSSDFETGQTASSNTWSEDSMTDVTRLSATSADLSFTSDSREDDNAAAWQVEWDRHCARQYAAEYLTYVRKQAGNNVEGVQVLLESQEIPEEVEEDFKEDQEDLVEAQEVPEECLEPLNQGCEVESSNGVEVPVNDESATLCEDDEKDVSAAAKPARDVEENESLTTNKQTSSRKRFLGLSVANSVGYLLQSLANESQPSDADGGGADKEAGQGDVASDAPANQDTGAGSNAATSTNYSASNGSSSGSDDDPPEQRPSRPAKRPHEEDADQVAAKQPNDNVGGALALLGLPMASPPLVGYAHFSKRPAAIRAQNRHLRFGNKQPRTSGINGDGELSDEELPGSEPIMGQDVAGQSSTNEETPGDLDLEVDIAETEPVEMDEDPPESGAAAAFTEEMVDKLVEMEDPAAAGSEEEMDDEPLPINNAVARSRAPFVSVPPPEPYKPKDKRKRNQRMRGVPPEVRSNPWLRKFWNRRFQLFSRFNEGIRMDAESWYSVTPEAVATHLAERCQCDLIVDAFCGAGGNAIQFAFSCERVIAVDIDPVKLSLARHNAEVYGVADRIEFVLGDFTRLAPSLSADVVFLSPPWGGLSYLKYDPFPLDRILTPLGGAELFRLARQVSENVAYFLPRNTDTRQVISLGGPGSQCEIEQSFLDRQHVAITAYYGELVHE